MKDVPDFLKHLFNENGVSIIDTDRQGRIQTSLEYTLQQIFRCMDPSIKYLE